MGEIILLENIIKLLMKYSPIFLEGLWVTLKLSFLTVVGGVIIGSIISLLRLSKSKIIRFIMTAYVEIIRGIPLLLQLWVIYLLLPKILGFDLETFPSVCLALVINSSAYVAEIIRAGINAVDKGQTEAARSLGLSKWETMIRIVFPQAIKNILPA